MVHGISRLNRLRPITKGFVVGVNYIGDQFGKGEAFLPELVMAGEAMKAAVSILEPEMARRGTAREMLGKVEVPEIGSRIQLVAAACGEFAALVLTDGQRTYATPVVKVGNTTAGKTGLWLFQIGERQEFGRFAVSATPFDPPKGPVTAKPPGVIRTAEYHAPDLPSPQDWVLVLEREKPQA